MIPPGIFSAIRARRSATFRLSASSSSTQGPAMTKSASSGKMRTSVTCLRERRCGLASLALHAHRRGDESREQRMSARWARLELGMELTADVPWVLRVLDDFHELAVRAQSRQPESVLNELIAVLVGHLVAVTMPLADLRDAIHLGDAGSSGKTRRIRAQAHGSTHVGHVLLRFHQGNHRIVAFR